MYYHDLLHIKWGYYEVGGTCPEHVSSEILRVHDRLEHLVSEEHMQGGTFRRIKEEMEQLNATRKSKPRGSREPPPNTEADGDQSRRG